MIKFKNYLLRYKYSILAYFITLTIIEIIIICSALRGVVNNSGDGGKTAQDIFFYFLYFKYGILYIYSLFISLILSLSIPYLKYKIKKRGMEN